MASPENNQPLPGQLPPSDGPSRSERNVGLFGFSYMCGDIGLTIGDQIHTSSFQEVTQTQATVVSFIAATAVTLVFDRIRQRRQ